MAKNVTKKRNIKIVAATMMAIFSLFVTFTGTFAWFLANRTIESDSSDDFKVSKTTNVVESIEFYRYLGTSTEEEGHTYFGFSTTNQSTISVVDGAVSGSAPSITLGTYSISDPHHPLLMLVKVNSASYGSIRAITDFSYLANDKVASPASTVASYAALNAVDTSSIADGTVYQVTADEDHGNVVSQYKFNASKEKWEMCYVDLKQDDNPLSSAVRAYAFPLEAKPVADNHDLYLYTNTQAIPDNSTTQIARDNNPTTTSCFAFDVDSFESAQQSQFVNMANDTYDDFDREITLYHSSGDENITYVAIIFDYYATSLDYLSYYFLGNAYLTDGLGFKCDWETII